MENNGDYQMRTKEISLNLTDILRKVINEARVFRYDGKEPEGTVLAAYMQGKSLPEEKLAQAESCMRSLMLRIYLKSKESLVIPEPLRLAGKYLEELPEWGVTLGFEDFYACQFVDRLNDIVRRAKKVRDLFAEKQSSENVRRLCQEAYQSYLYGYHSASVALIRSILEAVLKDRLGDDMGGVSTLNDQALDKGLYTKRIHHKIKQINHLANISIHEPTESNIPTEHTNLKLLGLAQEVLQVLLQ